MNVLRPFTALLDLVFPPRCLVCHAAPLDRDHFCPRCTLDLFADPHIACPRCAGTVGPFSLQDDQCATCRQHRPAFDAALRLGFYRGAMEQAVLRMKHAYYEGLAERLGDRFAERHQPRLTELS